MQEGGRVCGGIAVVLVAILSQNTCDRELLVVLLDFNCITPL